VINKLEKWGLSPINNYYAGGDDNANFAHMLGFKGVA
jgi:hypothetical protein